MKGAIFISYEYLKNYPTANQMNSNYRNEYNPTLKLGDIGEEVYKLQQLLTILKYYSGPINGHYDQMTINSVKAFQKDNNLKEDGIIGKNTWNTLNNKLLEEYYPRKAKQNIYYVKPGDTLYSIAKRFNTTVEDLIILNNLTSTILMINQQLSIPEEIIKTTAQNTYIIKPGDTLYSIAKKYNVTVDNLRKWNNLTTDILMINQELKIPIN